MKLNAFTKGSYIVTEPEIEDLGEFSTIEEIEEYLEDYNIEPDFSYMYLDECDKEVLAMEYNDICFYIEE